MKKTTLLSAGIVVLLVINAVTLGLTYYRPAHPPHRQNSEVITEILHFDEAQSRQYERQIAWHRANISRIDSRVREAKQELYGLLAKNDSTKKDSIISVIAGLHGEIEQVHFKHFADIKSICRPEQEVYFEQLVTKLPHLFGPKKPLPPR